MPSPTMATLSILAGADYFRVTGTAVPPAPTPSLQTDGPMPMRDRDVRNDIQARLLMTNSFDSVSLSGPPEQFSGASQGTAAWIEMDTTQYVPRWDASEIGDVVMTSQCRITFAVRQQDPQLRDEAVELMIGIAINALSGQSLAGLTMPQMTKPMSWRARPPKPPERRIEMIFTYSYLLTAGWASADTSE